MKAKYIIWSWDLSIQVHVNFEILITFCWIIPENYDYFIIVYVTESVKSIIGKVYNKVGHMNCFILLRYWTV